MQGIPAVAAGLFGRLNEEGFEYCVLGDVRGYPAALNGPLELVVQASTAQAFLELLKSFCDRSQLLLIERPMLPQAVMHLLIGWLNRERRPEFLDLHVRTDYYRCGRRLWRAADLLAERTPAVGLSHERDLFVPPPAKEFVRALLSCIDRNELSERDGEHLCLQWRLDPEGAALQVARFWDVSREGGIVLRAAVSGAWDPVRSARDALYSALAFHNVPSPAFWAHDLRCRRRRWKQPQGMLIACLGPDATCKTEIVERLAEHPLAPFERGAIMRLRPQVMRPAPPVRPPGPRAARGRLGTLAKLLLFAADYWVGYWLRVRPSLVRSTLLVSDRYFDDVLVNPRAYRMRRPRAFAKLVARWIPQPALWLVFDAPATSLPSGAQRSFDLERLRGEYRRVLRGRRNVVLLDASQTTEEVLAQAERAIAAQAARRTAQRLNLPMDSVENPLASKMLLFFCRRRVPLVGRAVRALFNSQIRCRTPSDMHLPHPYGVTIHAHAAIGRRVTIMQQVTIGSPDDAHDLAPVIGDDVYIGAGAKVLGDVRIGDRTVIGANAIVTRDVPAGSTVVGANRIITGRLTLATKRDANSSVAQFPVNAQRGGQR